VKGVSSTCVVVSPTDIPFELEASQVNMEMGAEDEKRSNNVKFPD